MLFDFAAADAVTTATAVRAQDLSAKAIVTAALERIAAREGVLNSFTDVLAEQAIADAIAVDKAIAAGQDPGPLAGVPFAVKNLVDIAGLTTRAGSKINRELPPATQDATLVQRLKQAGAVLVGALNMDEYAYGFVTENSHDGNTHNPHDLSRVAGGSSGGSGAAIAAGLVPLTLGSDTNGSIRVPAAFCGVFGLKPTYGRLSRSGCYPFVASLDHMGPLARSTRDLALSFDVMQGPDPSDPVCTERSPEPCLPQLEQGLDGLRIARAGGHFAQGAEPEVMAAVEQVGQALGVTNTVIIPEAHRARAAAYIITTVEGSNLHLANLKTRPYDFDPATRDRFLSGALVPGSWYVQAQRFRRWYRDQVRALFEQVDVIVAPTVPCVAPKIGQETMTIGGVEMLTRPNLGLYTQPLSLIGLPIVSVPVPQPGRMPVGVQLIAAPYQEARVLRAAAALEAAGVISAPIA